MAQIKDVMSPNFKFMAPDSPISQVAQQMRDMDAGFMPLACLLYTSPSPRDGLLSRMPSSA